MWFWYALLAAGLGSVENFLNKKALNRVSPLLMTWAAFALSLPLFFWFAFRNGVPQVNVWFFIGAIGSSVIFVFAKALRNNSLKYSLLSKLTPLTSFNAIFAYIFGLVFLSENIRFFALIGLMLIVLGTYIINVEKAKEDLLEPFKILFRDKHTVIFLIGLVLASLASIFDKTAVTNIFPSNVALALFVEDLIMTIILTFYIFKKEKRWVGELKQNFGILTIYSVLYAVVSGLVFAAFASGPIALSIGVKRLEVIFTLLLGYIFLNDKPPKYAWIGTLIMLLGVILIKL